MYFIGNYVFSNCCKALKISMKVGLKKINKYTFPPKRDHGFLSFSREAGGRPWSQPRVSAGPAAKVSSARGFSLRAGPCYRLLHRWARTGVRAGDFPARSGHLAPRAAGRAEAGSGNFRWRAFTSPPRSLLSYNCLRAKPPAVPPGVCANKLSLVGVWGKRVRTRRRTKASRRFRGVRRATPQTLHLSAPAPLPHISLLNLALPRSLSCRRPPPPPVPSVAPLPVPAPLPRPRSAGRRGRRCACSGRGGPRGAGAGGGRRWPGEGTPQPRPGSLPPRLLHPERLRKGRSPPPRGPAVPAERPVCRRRGGGRCCGRPGEPRDWPPPGGWRVSRAPGVALGAARPALWRDEAFRGMRSSLRFD